MASNEYDKLKEMYRLQGQEEQGRRFSEMVGAPRTYDAPAGPTADGLQAMSDRLERDRSMEARDQTYNQYRYASDDAQLAKSRLAEALGGDRFGVHGVSAEKAIGLVKELHKRGLITAATPELKQALGESLRRKAEVTRAESAADQAYGELVGAERVAPYRAGEEPKK